MTIPTLVASRPTEALDASASPCRSRYRPKNLRKAKVPSRAVVDQVVDQVAGEADVTRDELLGLFGSRKVSAARAACWELIIRSTGCSVYGLARVWGADPQSIRRQLLKRAAKTMARAA